MPACPAKAHQESRVPSGPPCIGVRHLTRLFSYRSETPFRSHPGRLFAQSSAIVPEPTPCLLPSSPELPARSAAAARPGCEKTPRTPPEARGPLHGSLYLLRQASIGVRVDGNPNHMASTRNRIGHFGRAISVRNGPKRRETAQNAPKRPESGPPPCPVWEMNSDASNATYVRSCAHPRHPPEQAVAASVRTGADGQCNIVRRIQSKTEQMSCPPPRPRYTRGVDQSAS
jgi:hypothetical protein